MPTQPQIEMNKRRTPRMQATALISLLGLMLAAPASYGSAQAPRTAAQSTDDARWYPWVGCWQRSAEAGAVTPVTCVRPSAGGAADILTISNGAVESREHLIVDGLPHAIDKDGCRGSQTATWSASGNRIYIGAAYTCSGSLRGRSTRLFAILPSGVWLEVRDVHAGGGWVETVTRFHDAGLPASVPADIRSEISHRELAVATARASASAPVTATDIAEATSAVDTAVVQSWLAARGQGFAADSVGAASNARVYYGSTPTPERQPPARTEYAPEPGCDAFGCYEVNGYSTYNGLVYAPYARPYVYGYGPSYYVPYLAPLVVVRGGSRNLPRGGRPIGGHPTGGRPPIGNTPGGHRPVGQLPLVQNPVGHTPPVHVPRTMPSRARP